MEFKTASFRQIKANSISISDNSDARSIFGCNAEEVLWLATAIFGNEAKISSCAADVLSQLDTAGYAAPVWHDLWTKRCVAQIALAKSHMENRLNTARYERTDFDDKHPFPLRENERQILRSMPAGIIIEKLDILARAVLILNGNLRLSLQVCAMLIERSRLQVETRCSKVMRRIIEVRNNLTAVQQYLGNHTSLEVLS
jgi:hypothetical protein